MRTWKDICDIALIGLIAMFPSMVGTYLVHAGYAPENSVSHVAIGVITFVLSIKIVCMFTAKGDRVLVWFIGLVLTTVIVNVVRVILFVLHATI